MHRPIRKLGQWVPCTYPLLNPKILSKSEKWKEEVPKIPPNFPNGLQYTTNQQDINRKFSQRRIEPEVPPSLRDFIDSSIDTRAYYDKWLVLRILSSCSFIFFLFFFFTHWFTPTCKLPLVIFMQGLS